MAAFFSSFLFALSFLYHQLVLRFLGVGTGDAVVALSNDGTYQLHSHIFVYRSPQTLHACLTATYLVDSLHSYRANHFIPFMA